MVKTTIAIARHGETDSNAKKLWVSDGDFPLNNNGMIQARLLAEKLKPYNFDFVISSDKLRAVQTSEIISYVLGIPYLGKYPIFRDRSYGEIEGLTSEEINEKYGIKMENSLNEEIDKLKGVENIRDLEERVKKGIKMILDDFKNSRVILITHGAFIRMAYRIFKGSDVGIYFYNCSYFIIECTDYNCQIANDIVHISQVDSS